MGTIRCSALSNIVPSINRHIHSFINILFLSKFFLLFKRTGYFSFTNGLGNETFVTNDMKYQIAKGIDVNSGRYCNKGERVLV